MKITNQKAIKESEKEFIDLINAELDWEAIENLLYEKHNFTLREEVEYKKGDLIVHDGSVAYKFDFDIKVPLSIILNRSGEFLKLSTSGHDQVDSDNNENSNGAIINAEGKSPGGDSAEKQRLASDLADMISEINQED